MRVCHVLHTLGPGGAQDLMRHLADSTGAGSGLELQVLALTPTRDDDLASALIARGVPVASADVSRRAALRRPASLLRLLQAARPDVVHTHGKHADVLGGAVARALRLPVVSTVHLIEQVDKALPRVAVHLSAEVRRRAASRVVVVSEAQRQWYLRTFPRINPGRVATVSNGVVDVRRISAHERTSVRASLGAMPGTVLVVALGMMRPDRGHENLVAAARLLPDTAITVALVGDGPQRSSLEAQAAGARGAPVCFPGYTRDVDPLLRAADLVVHPSLEDALPTALLQALAAGVPIVASDVGGIPEIVTCDVGALVPPADPQALAAAVYRLATDPCRRAEMAVAARRRYLEQFTADRWASRLRAIYDQVLVESGSL